jgi:hypothetical protein
MIDVTPVNRENITPTLAHCRRRVEIVGDTKVMRTATRARRSWDPRVAAQACSISRDVCPVRYARPVGRQGVDHHAYEDGGRNSAAVTENCYGANVRGVLVRSRGISKKLLR